MTVCEYVPIPDEACRRMLDGLEVKEGELVYDLGSGTGNILIMAAKEYGARCVGIEMSQRLVDWSLEDIKKLGLEDRITVIRENIFSPRFWAHLNGDDPLVIRNADVVTMYLTLQVQAALKERLEKELKPGTRVGSYAFKLSGWKPVKEIPYEEAPIYIFEKGRSF
jgi:precorrin-6B methylase 2